MRLLTTLAVIATLALGLYLRWDRLEYTEYTRDQAWVLNRVYDWLTKGDFPLVGIQSSVGTAQGAIEIYLLAIPVALSKDPRVAAGFVGVLQVLAIFGTYLFCSTYFGRKVGLVAALLYAVNPWALQYARKVWTPNMAPIFTILFFSALYAAMVQRRRYQMALACLWAMLLFLTHPSAVYLAPFLLVVAVAYWRRLGPRPLLLGVLLAAIPLAPYLWHEYQQDFVSFRLFFGLSAATASVDLASLTTVLAMASAKYFPTMMGYSFTGDWLLPDLSWQNELATWLLYAGLAWAVWGLLADWRRPVPARTGEGDKYALLLLWFAMPVLVTVRHSLEFYPHYFVNVLPLPYLLVGLGLSRSADLVFKHRRAAQADKQPPLPLGEGRGEGLWPDARRHGALTPTLSQRERGPSACSYESDHRGRTLVQRAAARLRPTLAWSAPAVVAVVALYLATSQTLYFLRYLDYVERQEPLGHYGIPLLYSQRAVDTVRALRTELGNPTVYSYTSVQWHGINYLSLPERAIWEVDPREDLALPRDPSSGALFLLADDSIVESDRKPFVARGDAITGQRLRDLGYVELPERAVHGPLGYTYYRFFYLSPERARQTLASFGKAEQLPLNNGMRLRGYSLPKAAGPGEKVTLAVLWEVPNGTGQPVGDEYNLFAHVLDNAGRELMKAGWEIGQYQHRYWRYYLPMWRAEDLAVAYYELELPRDRAPGLLWLDLGAYKRLDYADARWQDASGQVLPGAAKAGPLKVRPSSAVAPPLVPFAATFGSALELQGYDLTPAVPHAGEALEVALHWRASAQPPGDYTVSVQVLDQAGRLVAQHDSPPVGGRYPTSAWEQGETVVDRHSLRLPAGGAPDSYTLALVVYSTQTQQRLSVAVPDGRSADNLSLGPLVPR